MTEAHQQVLTPRGNVLPPEVHAVLTKEDIGDGKIIVIGDIHGCSKELQDLLSKFAPLASCIAPGISPVPKCEFRHGTDTVILVGDLVGKGPNAIEVLRDTQKNGYRAVRGNWDENALAAFARSHHSPTEYEDKWQWLRHVSNEDIAFMNRMPFSISIPSHGCIVVHAGLVPGIPLQEQDLMDLIEMRHVDLVDPPQAGSASDAMQKWRAIPKFPREAGKPWATVWPGPRHVIFGHHARRRLQECSFASGIDTGCCHGDQLTALVLPPIKELESRQWSPPREGVTRENLGAKLVSVQAREKYVKDDKD